jgi:uncharacterized membrane protein YphA (DoxX/SURF4 family)
MNLHSALREKWLGRVLRWLVGGVFLWAGTLKLLRPDQFATAVGNYRLLPHEWINLIGITLPGIEVVAGLLLLAGPWVRASALVVTGMSGVFFVAIISALARGLNIECGCFGTVGGKRVGWTSLALDVALLSAAVWLTWRYGREEARPQPAGPAESG